MASLLTSVTMKEYGEDADALFVDKAEEQAQKAKDDHEAAARVPGLLKPDQIEDDEDL